MGGYAVLKGTAYTMSAMPDMVLHNGATQTTEMVVNPGSEYLNKLPDHLRSYEEVINYMPNQVYIGGHHYEELKDLEFPWFDKPVSGKRKGKFGEVMPQDEFIGLMQICDVFELVKLEKNFSDEVRVKLEGHSLIGVERAKDLEKNLDCEEEIKRLVDEEHAEPLYHNRKLVGAVKKAHDVDINLSAHVMLENLVSKASSVLSMLHLMSVTGTNPAEIDYVIDCCEEACGDINQRGGGNFAKAAAETAGLCNATGADIRGFCAGPAHAILSAASMIRAGTFKKVVVTAGGCTAKLGMNGKDHVKKGMPILEDIIAGFAVLFTADDGVSPQVRTDIVGRHMVGTGSSPQAVISSLVTAPLDKIGWKITDIDKYAPEMQNPDITKPAGAGDVPESNYKMIAALGVKRGELEKSEIAEFVEKHGMVGWAPTQGHIPSGVPYLGFAREDIMSGKVRRAMFIGKGSLFLGRLTNLFDGVSVVIEVNDGKREEGISIDEAKVKSMIGRVLKTGEFGAKPVIGIAAEGGEHGEYVIEEAIKLAEQRGCKAVHIKGKNAHADMERMLGSGEIDGAVTMHYPFPIGVSTVGKVITPSKGKEMFIATTTGTSDTDRVAGMVKNAIYGIIAAKSSGIATPTVGIANIDGARQAEKLLVQLFQNGYPIRFAESARYTIPREDGGAIMRGNDLLMASADVMVMDSLTGNLMMKMFSAYTTGGSYEATGCGYGPGIGPGYEKLIMIVSRASGAPVIAGAVEYATQFLKRDGFKISKDEFDKAENAGLSRILKEHQSTRVQVQGEKVKTVKAPPNEPVTAEISGIDVMELEGAVSILWERGIYAESGMGCTGPIILIHPRNKENAVVLLKENGNFK